MAEVRKYFCCTDNLTGCKIVGGVQIALNAIFLIIFIYIVGIIGANEKGDASAALGALDIIVLVVCCLGIPVAILLVVGAVKRSATCLMVFIVLNGIGMGIFCIDLLVGLFDGGPAADIILSLVDIGIGIWTELIAIGARQELKSGAGIA